MRFMVMRISEKSFSFLTTIGYEKREKILTTMYFMVMRILKILLTTIYKYMVMSTHTSRSDGR